MKKSKGHVEFIGDYEYFVRGNDLLRANKIRYIAPDGYRSGRWCCRLSMKDEWLRMTREASNE